MTDGWFHHCDLRLRGGRLQVADRQFIGISGEGVTVPIQSGTYSFECEVATVHAAKRLSRVRIYPKDTSVVIGESLGEVDVDFGYVAAGDFDLMDAAARKDEDRYQDWIESLMDLEDADLGTIHCRLAGCDVPFVEAGIGDGNYTARELLSDDRVVGVEVDFLGR